MYISHLELTNVRTFRHLALDLGPGIHVIAGENAQGKSNLLDGVQMLATTRTLRSGSDIDLIAWDAVRDEPLPAARLEATVETKHGRRLLEIAVIAAETMPGIPPSRASRRFRVNGIARRASDLVGQLRVVMFSADDLHIIDGPPGNRRRYLDITISQLDPAYLRALQRYTRVLEQRNSLLRRIAERRAKPDELDFWDDELAEAGAIITTARAEAVRRLARDAAEKYTGLAATEAEDLRVCYEPRLPGALAEAVREHDFAARFRAALGPERQEDVRRGMTRWGPHRDDVQFLIGGHPAAISASRGQQRTAALALRLAEIDLSTARTGDAPVLLLDDILSELDPGRRQRVLSVAYNVDQVLITTPDARHPSHEELPAALRYRLAAGAVTPEADGEAPTAPPAG